MGNRLWLCMALCAGCAASEPSMPTGDLDIDDDESVAVQALDTTGALSSGSELLPRTLLLGRIETKRLVLGPIAAVLPSSAFDSTAALAAIEQATGSRFDA